MRACSGQAVSSGAGIMAARNFSEEAVLSKIDKSRIKDQFARATTLEPQSFDLPFPPSVNSSTFNRKESEGGGRALTDRAEAWVLEAGKELNRQKPKAYIVPVEIWVYLEECRPNADCSNYFKKVEDLLVSHRIIEDDNRKFVRSTHQVWSPETKGCRVSIRPAPSHGGAE